MKELTLEIASMVFMGHEPGTDRELVTKVNKAFTITTRAGNAIIRTACRRSRGGEGCGRASSWRTTSRRVSRSAAARTAPIC